MSDPREAFADLDDYQLGTMDDAEAAGFEEELFESAAAGNATEASFVDKISLLQQYLAPRGGLDIGSTRQRIEQVIAAGLRVQVVAPEPAPVMQLPPIDAEAEIVVTHIPVDVRGWDAVDVEVSRKDGTLVKTFRDVNHDPEDGSLYALCEAPLARLSTFKGHIVSRIIGHRAGKTETIAIFETIGAP